MNDKKRDHLMQDLIQKEVIEEMNFIIGYITRANPNAYFEAVNAYAKWKEENGS